MTSDLARIALAARPRRSDPADRLCSGLRRTTTRQVGTFAVIGVVSTISYLTLYALLRVGLPATVSNALALLATALGNTAANRRLTFRRRGSDGLLRHHLAGLGAFLLALAITSGSIVLLEAVAPTAGRLVEMTVLVIANGTATLMRFLVLRRAIDGPRRPTISSATPERTQA